MITDATIVHPLKDLSIGCLRPNARINDHVARSVRHFEGSSLVCIASFDSYTIGQETLPSTVLLAMNSSYRKTALDAEKPYKLCVLGGFPLTKYLIYGLQEFNKEVDTVVGERLPPAAVN